jgi:hypothetical protein
MKIRPAFLAGSALVSLIVACSAPEAPPAKKADSNVKADKDKNEPTKDDGPAAAPTDQPAAATGTDAQKKQCFDTCLAGTASKALSECGSKCKDDDCGEKCFEDHCTGKEEQCMADQDKCATQCKLGPSEEEIKCTGDCIAKSVAGPYDACDQKCENAQCGEKCFTDHCAGKEQQCDQAIDACYQQCAK